MRSEPEWNEIVRQNAGGYVSIAIANIGREFPSGIRHTMTAPGDFPDRPRTRNRRYPHLVL